MNNANKRSELIDLIKNDPFNLLKIEDTNRLSVKNTALVSSFEEIQEFVEDHGREPQSNISNINEFKLFARLKALRQDPQKIKILKKYDFKSLLNGEKIKEITVEDIISDDPHGLIKADIDQDIFKLRHVKSVERIKPDYLSRRNVCRDFSLYKEMFKTIYEELKYKKRRLIKYSSIDLNVGNFYALNGILLYLKSIEGSTNKYKFESGKRERFDGRTLCIFDNGTQSDMLFRSLDKAMQIDGYSISSLISDKYDDKEKVNASDVLNGFIYVLKSRNSNVQNIQNLYKIGYTTSTVADRIKNAKNEATYLFNDVDVVSTFRCFNIRSYNLEQTIHVFFARVKLDIELVNNNGVSYKPKEWFKVSIDVVEDAINLILNNTINEYLYDPIINQIIKK